MEIDNTNLSSCWNNSSGNECIYPIQCGWLFVLYVRTYPVADHLLQLGYLWQYYKVFIFSRRSQKYFSSILLTNIVGVGSSGSLMGMLGAWLVFIFYTWYFILKNLPMTYRRKIPPDQRCHRNCQLFSVLFAITVTVNIHTTLMM